MVLNIAHFKIAIISVSVFPILVFLRPARAQPPQWTPDELMRQVVSNELRAEDQDHSHWMFRLEEECPNGSRRGGRNKRRRFEASHSGQWPRTHCQTATGI